MRQEDQTYPNLFTATVQGLFKTVQLEVKGINIDGEKLSDLRFDDDQPLTTECITDMEKKNPVNVKLKGSVTSSLGEELG